MDVSDDLRWRLELEADCRLIQIDKILVSLMIFFPNCASMDHLAELVKMAEWLEEDHFIEATSYVDYMDRIYVRLLKMEIRFPNKAAVSHGMQSQMYNQGQGQQLLSQNDTIVSDGTKRSASLSPALPSMTKRTHTSVLNVVAGLKRQSGIAKKQFSSQESNDVGRSSTNTQSETVGRKQQLMKQNLLQPTKMPNVVGRRTNTQSEIAHAQDLFQQKKQQHQLFSSSMNSNAQAGQNADDWQEEIYQKMQAIKQKCLPYLKDIYQKNFKECQHLKRNDSASVSQSERQKLILLDLLESHIRILNVSKDSVIPAMKDNLSNYEKQVINVIKSNWPPEPVSARQQLQQPGGPPVSTQPQPQPQPQQKQPQPQPQQQQQPQPQPQQQQEEVDNQADATHEIIDVITDSD